MTLRVVVSSSRHCFQPASLAVRTSFFFGSSQVNTTQGRAKDIPRGTLVRCASRVIVVAASNIVDEWIMPSSTSKSVSRSQATSTRRPSHGTAIVWFRNDLRVHDNESLVRALNSAAVVVPVFVFDPRIYGTTHHFGFPKTAGFRAQFLVESVADLRSRLISLGSNLVIRQGLPETILPQLARQLNCSLVVAQKETTDEELGVERRLTQALGKLQLDGEGGEGESRRIGGDSAGRRSGSGSRSGCAVEWVWGSTMYHRVDLPFPPEQLPDVYTQFRKAVESRSQVRPPFPTPSSLSPFLPEAALQAIGGVGDLPSVEGLGVTPCVQDPRSALQFRGGETAALSRVQHYFFATDSLASYKLTRNGMLGADFSSKLAPWLALGCVSPRYVHTEVKRYEAERVGNESTYWLLFELIWRDYFRFLSIRYGNHIFHAGGPRQLPVKGWSTDVRLFDAWRTGTTGYPLVDANMRELAHSGFMSNRGRQIVCSFLVRDLGLDWRMGAEWFESLLLDFDPASNYGNWTYGAGVGNDPREDRYFSIPKQAATYDPDGAYVAHWIPELAKLPASLRHNPTRLTPSERALHGLGSIDASSESYPSHPIVPLKFGFSNAQGQGGRASGGRSGGRGRSKGRGGGSDVRLGRKAQF